MGGSPRSQRLGFISVYQGKKFELCEVDLVSGERELCPILFQFPCAGSCWLDLGVSVLAGSAVLANRACYQPQQIHPFYRSGPNPHDCSHS